MKKVLLCVVFCLGISLYGVNSWAAIFIVDSNYNSVSDYPAPGSSPGYTSSLLDTGIDFVAGDILQSNAVGLWRTENPGPQLFTDADGHDWSWSYGYHTATLVGEITSGTPHRVHYNVNSAPWYFVLGTSYNAPVNTSGRLYLGFMDTDYGNNEGYVTVNLYKNPGVVPEPSSLLLIGAGGIITAFVRRKRKT